MSWGKACPVNHGIVITTEWVQHRVSHIIPFVFPMKIAIFIISHHRLIWNDILT